MRETQKNDSYLTHIYGSRPPKGRLPSFKNTGRFLVLILISLFTINQNYARVIPEKSVHHSPFTLYREVHDFPHQPNRNAV